LRADNGSQSDKIDQLEQQIKCLNSKLQEIQIASAGKDVELRMLQARQSEESQLSQKIIELENAAMSLHNQLAEAVKTKDKLNVDLLEKDQMHKIAHAKYHDDIEAKHKNVLNVLEKEKDRLLIAADQTKASNAAKVQGLESDIATLIDKRDQFKQKITDLTTELNENQILAGQLRTELNRAQDHIKRTSLNLHAISQHMRSKDGWNQLEKDIRHGHDLIVEAQIWYENMKHEYQQCGTAPKNSGAETSEVHKELNNSSQKHLQQTGDSSLEPTVFPQKDQRFDDKYARIESHSTVTSSELSDLYDDQGELTSVAPLTNRKTGGITQSLQDNKMQTSTERTLDPKAMKPRPTFAAANSSTALHSPRAESISHEEESFRRRTFKPEKSAMKSSNKDIAIQSSLTHVSHNNHGSQYTTKPQQHDQPNVARRPSGRTRENGPVTVKNATIVVKTHSQETISRSATVRQTNKKRPYQSALLPAPKRSRVDRNRTIPDSQELRTFN